MDNNHMDPDRGKKDEMDPNDVDVEPGTVAHVRIPYFSSRR